MNKITRPRLKEITSDIMEALKGVGEKHNINLEYKGASFADLNFTMKIEGAVIGADGTVIDKSRTDFLNYAKSYNLLPDMIDKTFVIRGTEYKITGLSPRKPKFPILADRVKDGKKFKFPAITIRNSINLTVS